MAVLTAPATALTIADIITRVRELINDPRSTRWSNTAIMRQADYVLEAMDTKARRKQGAGFLATTTITYNSNEETAALPAGLNANSIYKIEDVTDSTKPTYIPPIENMLLRRDPAVFGWALQGNAIALTPIPTESSTLRIGYFRNFIPVSGSADLNNDQHAGPVNHQELLVVGTAVNCLSVSDSTPKDMKDRLAACWERFDGDAPRVAGPLYIGGDRQYD